MDNYIEIHLKPQTLERYGLPDIPFPTTLCYIHFIGCL